MGEDYFGDGIIYALVSIDRKGIITQFNNYAEQLFQWKKEEVLGKRVNILMPEPYKSKHDGYIEAYHRTKHKKLIGCPRMLKGIRKDGSIFNMEISLGERKASKSQSQSDKLGKFVAMIKECKEVEAQSRYAVDFQQIEELGAGAFGSVYKCRNKLDGETYAVKKIRIVLPPLTAGHGAEVSKEEDTKTAVISQSYNPSYGSGGEYGPKSSSAHHGEEATKRKLKETFVLAKLDSHPNVVRYYTAWMENEDRGDKKERMLYIQMELCGTLSLKKWLSERDEQGKLVDVKQNYGIFVQIVRGLNHIHESGYIHRDIKPGNILISTADSELSAHDRTTYYQRLRDKAIQDARYLVKIGDFGLATRRPPPPLPPPRPPSPSARRNDTPGSLTPSLTPSKPDLQRVISPPKPVASPSKAIKPELGRPTSFPLERPKSPLPSVLKDRSISPLPHSPPTPHTPRPPEPARAQSAHHLLQVQSPDMKKNDVYGEPRIARKRSSLGASPHQTLDPVAEEGKVVVPDPILVATEHENYGPLTSGIGTTLYAPDEQLHSGNYDEKADIFSLGLVFVELFNRFLDKKDKYRSLHKIKQGGSLPLKMLLEYPQESTFVAKLLQKDPTLRPSAREILEDPLFCPYQLRHQVDFPLSDPSFRTSGSERSERSDRSTPSHADNELALRGTLPEFTFPRERTLSLDSWHRITKSMSRISRRDSRSGEAEDQSHKEYGDPVDESKLKNKESKLYGTISSPDLHSGLPPEGVISGKTFTRTASEAIRRWRTRDGEPFGKFGSDSLAKFTSGDLSHSQDRDKDIGGCRSYASHRRRSFQNLGLPDSSTAPTPLVNRNPNGFQFAGFTPSASCLECTKLQAENKTLRDDTKALREIVEELQRSLETAQNTILNLQAQVKELSSSSHKDQEKENERKNN